MAKIDLIKTKYLLLLILLALCWGPSFFFIKVALTQIPIFSIVCIRLAVGGLLVLLIIQLQKKHFFKWLPMWRSFVIIALLANVIPLTLITYSETLISSSLAGIINSSPPIFTVILAHYFLDHEKISLSKIIGMSIAFMGIALIFLPSLLGEESSNILGVIYVLIASISSAGGMVFARKRLSNLPNLIAPTYQMLLGSLILLPLMLGVDKIYSLPIPSLPVLSCLLGLSVLGTMLAYVIYYYLVTHVSATYLSTSSLLFPLISTFLGVVVLKESLSPLAYVGSGFILLGLVITNALISSEDLKNLFKVKKD